MLLTVYVMIRAAVTLILGCPTIIFMKSMRLGKKGFITWCIFNIVINTKNDYVDQQNGLIESPCFFNNVPGI